jgi:hypothetical protein
MFPPAHWETESPLIDQKGFKKCFITLPRSHVQWILPAGRGTWTPMPVMELHPLDRELRRLSFDRALTTDCRDVKDKRGVCYVAGRDCGLTFSEDVQAVERKSACSNQASLDSRCRTAKAVISEVLPGRLKALFGPQHGIGGEDQDNMIETGHSRDRELNLPVFSLYSEVREPSKEMLDLMDVLVVDLQDVGTRVYTFSSTLLGCMKACARSGKKVVVLDRPNPLGGDRVEGNLLVPEHFSFVGPYRLPMRHGLTLGEMARLFDHVFNLGL